METEEYERVEIIEYSTYKQKRKEQIQDKEQTLEEILNE